MSRFLNAPITEKQTAIGETNGMKVGQSNMQGWRDTMEDAHLMALHLENARHISVFGIFDGHGGDIVAKAVAEMVLSEIMTTDEYKRSKKHPNDLAKAMCKGFIMTDRRLKENVEFKEQSEEIGSTGLVVMITPTHVIVGNVGDTRCIISSNKEVKALSIDHKPNDEQEKQRIEKAGGNVFRNRVCGGVAVSRSFGDYWFKRNTELKDNAQQVTAEPDIRVHERSSKDEFLLLACDGIYDVLSNEQVQQFVRQKIQAGFKNPGTICELLLDECLGRGSRDNMSVILILFEGASRYSKKGSCAIQ